MFHKSEMKAVKSSYEEAQAKYESQNKLLQQVAIELYATKRQVVETVEQVGIQTNQLNSIDDIIRWQNINAEVTSFQGVEKLAQNQVQNDMDGMDGSNGIVGAATGIGVGVAGVAAPGALVALTTTFGVASTGTAISTLSGAALTNATIAAIGGGSMAAGSTLLGALGPIGLALSLSIIGVTGIRANKKNKEIIEKYESYKAEIESAYEQNVNVVTKIKSLKDSIEAQLGKLNDVVKTNDISNQLKEILEMAKLLNTSVVEG